MLSWNVSKFLRFVSFLFSILSFQIAEGDLTPEVLSDIALIYSHNPLEVVSADAAKRIEVGSLYSYGRISPREIQLGRFKFAPEFGRIAQP